MEYTHIFENVIQAAKAMAQQRGDSQERMEYYLAALLEAAMAEDAEAEEICELRALIADSFCGNPAEVLQQVKENLDEVEDLEELDLAEPYINIAKKYAVESYLDIVSVSQLMAAILHRPTEFVKRFLKEKEVTIHFTEEEVEALMKLLDEIKIED